MNFKIVVPTYNAAPWIEACLRSIADQTHKDFDCLVIDDASDDGTFELLSKMKFLDERFVIMRNAQNLGPLANTWIGFERLGCRKHPESVLTIVDGDDRLSRDDALAFVANHYTSDPNLLMTYGNYADDTNPTNGRCSEFPPSIVASRAFREYSACVSCLRTCKAKIWNCLRKSDMLDPSTGDFFSAGGDVAYCLPLLELAGTRFKFIREILYTYTTSNPISDFRIRQNEQIRVDRLVRSYPRYPLFKE